MVASNILKINFISIYTSAGVPTNAPVPPATTPIAIDAKRFGDVLVLLHRYCIVVKLTPKTKKKLYEFRKNNSR